MTELLVLLFSAVILLGVIIPILFYIWSKLLWIELHGILSALQSIGREVWRTIRRKDEDV